MPISLDAADRDFPVPRAPVLRTLRALCARSRRLLSALGLGFDSSTRLTSCRPVGQPQAFYLASLRGTQRCFTAVVEMPIPRDSVNWAPSASPGQRLMQKTRPPRPQSALGVALERTRGPGLMPGLGRNDRRRPSRMRPPADDLHVDRPCCRGITSGAMAVSDDAQSTSSTMCGPFN